MALTVQFAKELTKDELVFSIHEPIYFRVDEGGKPVEKFTTKMFRIPEEKLGGGVSLAATQDATNPEFFWVKLLTKIPARKTVYYLQIECNNIVCNSEKFKISKAHVKASVIDNIVESNHQGTRVWIHGVFPPTGMYLLEILPIGNAGARRVINPEAWVNFQIKFRFWVEIDATLVLHYGNEEKIIRHNVRLLPSVVPNIANDLTGPVIPLQSNQIFTQTLPTKSKPKVIKKKNKTEKKSPTVRRKPELVNTSLLSFEEDHLADTPTLENVPMNTEDFPTNNNNTNASLTSVAEPPLNQFYSENSEQTDPMSENLGPSNVEHQSNSEGLENFKIINDGFADLSAFDLLDDSEAMDSEQVFFNAHEMNQQFISDYSNSFGQ